MTASQTKASRGFEPRSLDSESRVLTVTPRGHLNLFQADTQSLFTQSIGATCVIGAALPCAQFLLGHNFHWHLPANSHAHHEPILVCIMFNHVHNSAIV